MFEDKLVDLERDNQETTKTIESSPCLPKDLVRQGEVTTIYDKIRRVNQHFQAVEMDMSSLSKRTDEEKSQQRERVDTKLREHRNQFFEALNHKSQNKLNLTRLSDNLKVTRNKKVKPNRHIDLLDIVGTEMDGVTSKATLKNFELRCRRQQPVATIEKDPRDMNLRLKLARIKLKT
ncbi:hypothetical protein PsorP6_015190 [Peronosclerospora sorghi]|uniref:Uncharacterized protein n=1 Tax=Peronosclerospora sorghi TaxID=230839 RepID=A0ACC0VRX6_9STRA|nr:hypothetical protein PsorP6_015190 [Peronosclerospora sorghi]